MSNFTTGQTGDYTYYKNKIKSYIDHIPVPHYIIERVKKCSILYDEPDNVSDRMALSLIMEIPNLTDKQTIDGEFKDIPVYPRCIWNDVAFRDCYMTEVNRKMELLLPLDIDIVSKSNVQQTINTLCDNLCQAIHESASKVLPKPSKNIHQKPHKNKRWWDKDCTQARRSNRIFHHIWKQSGRPDSGVIYKCYKEAKRNYRSVCRSAINGRARLSFLSNDRLHSEKRSIDMWNLIRKSKPRNKQSEAITTKELAAYFTKKFSAPTNRTTVIQKAENNVNEKYETLMNNPTDKKFIVSEQSIIKYIKLLKGGLE